MTKKKIVHWHRIEGWPIDKPEKRFAVADKFYDNAHKAQEAAAALNRRYQDDKFEGNKFAFEAKEHCPKGAPFTEKGGVTIH